LAPIINIRKTAGAGKKSPHTFFIGMGEGTSMGLDFGRSNYKLFYSELIIRPFDLYKSGYIVSQKWKLFKVSQSFEVCKTVTYM